jgi:hypothetical protein
VQLLVRISPEIRKAIERDAMRFGKSLSAQAEAMLIEAASGKTQADRRTRALRYLVGGLCETLQAADRAGGVAFDWRTSRFDFEALRAAIERLLERLAPAGEIETGRYPSYATPDDLARDAAGIAFMLLHREKDQLYGEGARRGAAAGSLFYRYPHVAADLDVK